MTLHLPDGGFWYLATPYTNYPAGHQNAWDRACRVAARLLQANIPVFSPIAHGHQISRSLEADTHEFWMKVNRPLMDAAHGLIVVTMDGWWESRGITEEREIFTAAGKPVIYLPPALPTEREAVA